MAVGEECLFGFIRRSLNIFKHNTCPSCKCTAVSERCAATRANNLLPLPSMTVRHTTFTLSKQLEYVWNFPWSVWSTWTTGHLLPSSKDQEHSVIDWTKLHVNWLCIWVWLNQPLADGMRVSIGTSLSSGKSSGCWTACLTKSWSSRRSFLPYKDGSASTFSKKLLRWQKNSFFLCLVCILPFSIFWLCFLPISGIQSGHSSGGSHFASM